MTSVARVFPTIAAVLLTALLPRAAVGQRFVAERSLASVSSLRVASFLKIDDVDRECVPDARVLEAEAELVFRRSGVSVADGSPSTFAIELVALQTDGGLCIAAHAFQLVTGAPGSGLSNLQAYFTMGVMSGPRYNFQDRLRTVTNQVASDLANEMLRAQAE